jgi:uncharacterized protein
MHMRKKFQLATALFILLIALCVFFTVNKPPHDDTPVILGKESSISVGTTTIAVEIVRTDEEKARGLSGREELPAGHGMLFVFTEPDFHSFWMKDMKFAIDIIWLDELLRITHIEKNVQPDSYPKIFKPLEKSLYALEVTAGFSEQKGLTVGGTLILKK